MKKVFFISLLVLIATTSLNAQDGVRFGATLGLNISGVSGDDTDGTDSRTGFRGGVVADIPIAGQFSFQPAAIISIQGWKDGGLDIKANYVVIEAKGDFEVVDGLSVQAGPTLGFNIHASVDGDDIANFESTDFGALFGAQYEFPMGLFLNVQYALGFSELISGFDANNRNFSASVGFFFN